MNKPDMQRLTSLFGSAAEIARITGASRAAVARWGRYNIGERYQKDLIEAAFDKDLDPFEVAYAVGMPRCPACGSYHLNGKPLSWHKEAQS